MPLILLTFYLLLLRACSFVFSLWQMHWFSMRPCAKISVLLCMKVCWCQKEYIFSTFCIKIRHEKSSYWIDLLSTSGCSLGASWSIAGEQVSQYYSAEPWLQPSQWTGLKHYPICLCWLFLQLILIRCQPQPLATLLLFVYSLWG